MTKKLAALALLIVLAVTAAFGQVPFLGGLPVFDATNFGNAIKRAYGLRTTPTPARMMKIGDAWRPYRSIACWYLWASLDNKPVGE